MVNMNSILSNVFGAAAAQNISHVGNMSQSSMLQNQAQNGYAQMGNQQAYAAQQHQINQLGRYNQALMPKWMINGRSMSIEEFGQELFGNDTPELTMFLLRYKDVNTKTNT